MNKFLLTFLLLLLPFGVFAQTGAIDVAGLRIIYDHEEVLGDGTTIYMFDGSLVISTHDSDDDGRINYWIIYEDDVVVKEIQDTDRDGKPDLIIDVDALGNDTSVSGERAGDFTASKPKDFWTLTKTIKPATKESPTGIVRGGEDLVGDINRIDIPSGGSLLWLYILLVAAAGGGYVWWKKRKQEGGDDAKTEIPPEA